MSESAFIALSFVVILAVVISGITTLLRQPAIIGYIITGIIAGPLVLNITNNSPEFQTFAHLGVTLLLFMVGLHLNPRAVRELGAVSLLAGVGQVLFSFLGGYIIGLMIGLTHIESIYVAFALTLSSTIVIMKLLADKKDTESLYGRITIGILIVQDVIAMIGLMLVSSLASGGDLGSLFTQVFLQGAGMLILLYFVGRYFLPKIIDFVAKSQEYLLLFSIGWCIFLASIFYYLNFSIEIGALLAGITLSVSPYRHEISSKMKVLRDFFILLFFVVLGSQMTFGSISSHIVPIIMFSLFVLIGNPIIVMAVMGLLGYSKRTSFQSGMALAQISEFSLILIGIGVTVGQVSSEILSLVTMIGIITIAGSSYMIGYTNQLYELLSPYLGIFEKKRVREKKVKNKHKDANIIVFGYHRIGTELVQGLDEAGKKFLVVDFDPERIAELTQEGVNCVFGDAEDAEFVKDLTTNKTKMIISSIPEKEVNELIIRTALKKNPKVIVMCLAHSISEAMDLYDLGAAYVILPHFLGGEHASTLLENYGFNSKKYSRERKIHLRHLDRRTKRGHDHPRR